MRFADLPIRQKLLAMALGITTIVLLASWAVLVAFDLVSLRRELLREFGTLSDVIAANSSAALAFGAQEDAAESLKTLSAERSVSLAALYDASGRLFASYSRAVDAPLELRPRPAYQVFAQGRLETYRPVTENAKVLGTLVVYTDLRWWHRRLWYYVVISLGVVGLAFLAATVVSAFLRKSITEPIDELTRIAKIVSDQGNFSVRANRLGNDELGELTDTFNHMLAQLQEREAELRDSEAQRLIALEAAGLGTWTYDVAGRSSVARDSSLNYLKGLRPLPTTAPLDELIGSIVPEDRSRVRALMEGALRDHGEIDAEYRIAQPQGAVRWVRNRGRVITGHNGAVVKMAGVVMDITERKKSEEEILRFNADLEKRVAQRTAELEDSNRNLEAFAYSVSHDLRAPLRIISGYSEVLLEDRGKELPPDHKMCLSRIVDGARRMNRLIDDLLQFSRLSQQPLEVQPTEMNVLVDDVLADLEREVGKRRVEWHRAPLPVVLCDPGLMRQVLSNLLSNALKYSRPRDPAIIEIGHELKDGMHIFFVKDNGVGFDSASSTRLFGVFQRMHSAQEFEGNGVGLATAARVVNRHGGRIWAESKVDEGATFFFSVPAEGAKV